MYRDSRLKRNSAIDKNCFSNASSIFIKRTNCTMGNRQQQQQRKLETKWAGTQTTRALERAHSHTLRGHLMRIIISLSSDVLISWETWFIFNRSKMNAMGKKRSVDGRCVFSRFVCAPRSRLCHERLARKERLKPDGNGNEQKKNLSKTLSIFNNVLCFTMWERFFPYSSSVDAYLDVIKRGR